MERLTVLGTPITPKRHIEQLSNESFCVSYFNHSKTDMNEIIKRTGGDQMLLLDNGAYSFFNQKMVKAPEQYWDGYYKWVADILNRCPMAIAVSPDVIGGSEAENRKMALDFSLSFPVERIMPVWHLNESLDYLVDLIELGHRYLAFGSTKEFKNPSSPLFHNRIREAFDVVDKTTAKGCGYARPWLHMLRYQDASRNYPFNSSDSANIARNHSAHQSKTNHLRVLVDRLKNKPQLITNNSFESPSSLAIQERTNQIQFEYNLNIIKHREYYGLEADYYSHPTLNIPDMNCPPPSLLNEVFSLTG